jgi:hypothetical protein
LFFDINSPPLFFSFTTIGFKFSEFNNVIIPSVLPQNLADLLIPVFSALSHLCTSNLGFLMDK